MMFAHYNWQEKSVFVFACLVALFAGISMAQAQELRPVAADDQQSDRTLALTAGALVASSATTARHISAVRLTCAATCFVGVSGSNGASMANFISGGYLAGGEPVEYRTTGGDYVIGITGAGMATTLYIQEMTR